MGVRLSAWARHSEQFIVDYIGAVPDKLPVLMLYDNMDCKTELAGNVKQVNTETLTLKEFLLQSYDPVEGILDYDWYNAAVDLLNQYEWSPGVISELPMKNFYLSTSLMRWYEYSLTLQPGQRLINSVTAPIYPAVDQRYEPPVYDYTYLLSPAKSWASFGSLDIEFKTAFELIECSLGDHAVNAENRSLHLESLPDGELKFSLSTDENPQFKSYPDYSYRKGLFIYGLIALAGFFIIVLAILFALKWFRKK